MTSGLCPNCGAAIRMAEMNSAKCGYCDSPVTRSAAEAKFAEVQGSKVAGTLLLAQTSQEGGDYSGALTFFNDAIKQDPSCGDAWLNKGICAVRSSKIGDLKFSEAIAAWKAAIKFAKNPDAMRKRVGEEIVQTIDDFYPVLEAHYMEFASMGSAFEEHVSRFLTMEAALGYALEISPGNAHIAKTGLALCERIVATQRSVGSGAMLSAFADSPKGIANTLRAVSEAATLGSEQTRFVMTRVAALMPKYAEARARQEVAEKQEEARLEAERMLDPVYAAAKAKAAAEAEAKAEIERMAARADVALGKKVLWFIAFAVLVLVVVGWRFLAY